MGLYRDIGVLRPKEIMVPKTRIACLIRVSGLGLNLAIRFTLEHSTQRRKRMNFLAAAGIPSPVSQVNELP